jgi:hypothetical protein
MVVVMMVVVMVKDNLDECQSRPVVMVMMMVMVMPFHNANLDT